jgi:iron complex outermembrane recepter protein
MKADNDFPGIGTQSSLGKFGPDNNVISRVQSRLTASTKIGMFAHALTATYKSGYLDSPAAEGDGVIRAVNANGTLGDFIDFSGRRVASYTTFDWQTRASITDALQLTVGVKNMFDRQPPFSIRFAGGGNYLGYDGRYADPLGRNFYIRANYKF